MLNKLHIIKINIWTQISYSSPNNTHLKKSKCCFCQKEEKNAVKLKKEIFSKITETAHWEPPRKATYSKHSIAIHSISVAGYVTAILIFVRAELRALETSSFCDFFFKWPLAILPYFTPFWLNQTFVFCDICLVTITIANLCPIMINFNALDFSECCSEEVISFFWCSVYVSLRTRRALEE